MKREMTIYVILGEREGVYQDEIAGPFVAHPEKEIVTAFESYEEANKFIISQRLKYPKKYSNGDTSNYKGGFYNMEIQSTSLQCLT